MRRIADTKKVSVETECINSVLKQFYIDYFYIYEKYILNILLIILPTHTESNYFRLIMKILILTHRNNII